MKKYEYEFVEVPVVIDKKGIVNIAHKGETFEVCKEIIIKESEKGWRLKQVVVPFNEKIGVYSADCYQVIFEKEIN